MKELGYILKIRRKEAGLTQKQLAELSEVSLMSIRRYESGESIPRLDIVDKISKALGHTRDSIFFTGDIEELNNEAHLSKLRLESFYDLTENSQDKVLTYIEDLASAETYRVQIKKALHIHTSQEKVIKEDQTHTTKESG